MKKTPNVDMEEVKALITEVEKTKKYDREQITECHNKIFDKEVSGDSDDSCLVIRMMQIKAWYQDHKK